MSPGNNHKMHPRVKDRLDHTNCFVVMRFMACDAANGNATTRPARRHDRNRNAMTWDVESCLLRVLS